MAFSSRLGGISVAMANRNYRVFTYGAIPSLLGIWIQRMAVGWYAWELTHSGFWLGLVAFVSLAPAVLVAPVAGAFADRVDRLKVVLVVQYINMAQAVILAVMTMSGLMTIELLAALSLLQGVTRGLNQPFRLSLIGSIVSRSQMTAAIGINSAVANTSRLIGPAISAMIILNFGVGMTFVVNALTFPPMILALHMIDVAPPPRTNKTLADVPAEIIEGIRFASKHEFIGPLLLLVFTFSFFGRAMAELLPGYTGAIFHFHADGLALLTGALGFGSLVSGFWLSRRGHLGGLIEILLASIGLLTVFQVAFCFSDILIGDPRRFAILIPIVHLTISASPDLLMGAVMITLWGFTINACGIIAQSLIQASVPDTMRGRVISLHGMLWLGMPAVGAFLMGAAADFVGFRWPVAAAAGVILFAGLWGFARRDGFRTEVARVATPVD